MVRFPPAEETFKDITRQSVPCWSKLAWIESPATIEIYIHKGIVSILEALSENDVRIQHSGYGKYGAFVVTPEAWGFGGALVRTPETEDGFFGFRATLPLVKKQKEDPCDHCKGKGQDEDLGRSCIYCEGTGHETFYDWDVIYPISASISILTSVLNHLPPEQDTDCLHPQLLTFVTNVLNGAFPLGGVYSGTLVDLLRYIARDQGGHCSIPLMENAMRIAWQAMEGEVPSFYNHEFYATITDLNGWLNIACPGDACGLHPHHDQVRDNGGYEFSCHNADHPIQQFTLLAALAALETHMRNNILHY